MEKELVSIIIPIYNASSSIERCLKSILNQTYKKLEILCVDDGSLDDSIDIIEKLKKNDDRIKIIKKTNGGVSSARNAGLDYAVGKYVQFVDSDDAIEPSMVETLVYNMEKNEVDFIICGYNLNSIDDTCCLNRKIYSNMKEFYEDFITIYQSTYLNPPWNKLYIRELIKCRFDEDMSLGEDLMFNLNYLDNIKKILIIPECLYIYSVDNENSLTRKYHTNSIKSLKKIILKIKKNLLYYDRNRLSNDETRLSDYYFTDYIRCLNSLINKSNKRYKDIINIIREWNKDDIVRTEIIDKAKNKSLLLKMLKFF